MTNNTSRNFNVALVGCGGRGNGALRDHLEAGKLINEGLGCELTLTPVATADNNADAAAKTAKEYDIPDDRCFSGLDSCRQMLDAVDADIVLMATPPLFVPANFEACIEAGKHVFVEKPVSVDPVGCRRVIATGEKAREKGLTVVAGTQRRHQLERLPHVAALRDGAYGRILGGRVGFCIGKIFSNDPIGPKTPDDLLAAGKWQLWVEMSGDIIVEQHIHNIDVANWYIGTHPEAAVGFCGRARRKAGNICDYFSTDFEYPGGVHIHSMARQIPGCWFWIGEEFTMEKDTAEEPSLDAVVPADLPRAEKMQVQEHVDMLYNLLKDQPLNEARQVAESTATAILGREAGRTGRRVTWAELMEAPVPEADREEGQPDLYNLRLRPSFEDFLAGDIPPELYPKEEPALPGQPH